MRINIREIYAVEKGNGTPEFAWQLTCNGSHVQWFSDEAIARRTCDELNHWEIVNRCKQLYGEDK